MAVLCLAHGVISGLLVLVLSYAYDSLAGKKLCLFAQPKLRFIRLRVVHRTNTSIWQIYLRADIPLSHQNAKAMDNKTVRDAIAVHGTDPQFLIEKILRTRIYECSYWKEQCFGLTGKKNAIQNTLGQISQVAHATTDTDEVLPSHSY